MDQITYSDTVTTHQAHECVVKGVAIMGVHKKNMLAPRGVVLVYVVHQLLAIFGKQVLVDVPLLRVFHQCPCSTTPFKLSSLQSGSCKVDQINISIDLKLTLGHILLPGVKDPGSLVNHHGRQSHPSGVDEGQHC